MSDAPTTSDGLLVFKPKPSLPPPPATTGVIGWMRFNLFDGIWSSITTVIGVAVLVWIALAFYDWAFAKAIWNLEPAGMPDFADRVRHLLGRCRLLVLAIHLWPLPGRSSLAH